MAPAGSATVSCRVGDPPQPSCQVNDTVDSVPPSSVAGSATRSAPAGTARSTASSTAASTAVGTARRGRGEGGMGFLVIGLVGVVGVDGGLGPAGDGDGMPTSALALACSFAG